MALKACGLRSPAELVGSLPCRDGAVLTSTAVTFDLATHHVDNVTYHSSQAAREFVTTTER